MKNDLTFYEQQQKEIDYVRSLEIERFDEKKLTIRAAVADTGEDEAGYVDAGALTSFVAGLTKTHKEDTLNSTLLAQAMYYKCIEHNYINIPGPKLHDQFNEVLKALAFKPHQIKDLVTKAKAMLVEPLKLKQEKTKENTRALQVVNEKIYLLEKRYMENEIESSTYKTWFKQYKEEKAELEMALSGRAKTKDSNEAVFERVLPWMSSLFGIYDKCTIYRKHSIVRGVFKDNLAYSEGAFRTPFIDPTFEDNSLIIKEKWLLFLEQPFRISDINPIRTQNRSRIGTGSDRCLRPVRLSIPLS